MDKPIEQHKNIMVKVRERFGLRPLCDLLEYLEDLKATISDADMEYLVGLEIDKVKLEIENNNLKSANNLITTDVKPPSKKEYYSVRSGELTYYVEKNMKHRLCHEAFTNCLISRKTLKDLGSDDYRRLAELIGGNEGSIKTTINRIRQDAKEGLSDEEKFYYLAWLSLKGAGKEIIKQTFPFLFNVNTSKEIQTA